MVKSIQKEAITLLEKASINGQRVTFPQVDYSVYSKVKPVMLALGAPWDKRQQAHIFPDDVDPDALIQTVLTAGVMPEQNPLAYFPTPPAVVEKMLSKMRQLVPAFPFCRILEPEAGEGAIAERVLDLMRLNSADKADEALLRLIELDEDRFQKLQAAQYQVQRGDFLATLPSEFRFDAILMNPPFAIAGRPRAYIDHILHAFCYWLELGGAMVGIVPGGFVHNSDRQTKAFRAMVTDLGGWELLPNGSFKHAKTDVSTVMLWMSKK